MKGSPVRVRASALPKTLLSDDLVARRAGSLGRWATNWATRRLSGRVLFYLDTLRCCAAPMLPFGAIFSGQGVDAAIFSVLLTVESLLFTVAGLVATLNVPLRAVRNTRITPSALGQMVALFITAVAGATVLMWTSVFDAPWPTDLRGKIVALVVLAATGGERVGYSNEVPLGCQRWPAWCR